MAITFSLFSGTLPAGLTLSTSGVISGTPTTPGRYAFTVQATDAVGGTANQAYALQLGGTGGGGLLGNSSPVAMVLGGSAGVPLPLQLANVVLGSSANPSVNNGALTLTVAVAPVNAGQPVPTGTVKIAGLGPGGHVINPPAVTLVNGIASVTVNPHFDTYSLTAVYHGDATFEAATSATYTQSVTASFTAPWEPPGLNVKTAFGGNNLAGGNTAGDGVKLQAIQAANTTGALLYFPADTYNLAGAGTNEVQAIVIQSAPPGNKFKLSLPNASGTIVQTADINYTGTIATDVAAVQSAINTVLGTSNLVIASDATAVWGYGIYLTYSGTGYAGLPQKTATTNIALATMFVVRHVPGDSVYFTGAEGSGSWGLIGDFDSNGHPTSILKTTVANGCPVSFPFGINYTLQNIQLSASTTGGVGLSTGFADTPEASNCYFSGAIGWNSYGEFQLTARSCTFNGSASTGIGFLGFATAYLFDGCDFNHWSEGMRICGAGASVIRSTFENNVYGIREGKTAWGDTVALSHSAMNQLTFTDNDYAIFAYSTGSNYNAITISGSTSSPAGQSVVGIDENYTADCVFNNIAYSGSFSTAGLWVENNSNANVAHHVCGGTNSYPGGALNKNDVTGSGIYFDATVRAPIISPVDDQTAYVTALANWTVVNVLTSSPALVGDNSTDNLANWNTLIAAETGPTVYYLPGTGNGAGHGKYKISGTVKFSINHPTAVFGDGKSTGGASYGSTVSGSFTGPLFAFDYVPSVGGSFVVSDLNLIGGSTNLGIHAVNPVLSSIHRIAVGTGDVGIKLISPANCCLGTISANGSTTTGIMLINLVNCTVNNLEISAGTGITDAFRACGTGLMVYDFRAETIPIAMNLGVDDSGNPLLLTNSIFQGLAGERNGLFIDAVSCQNCAFAGAGISGSISPPTQHGGIKVRAACKNLTFSGITSGGTYDDWSIQVLTGASNVVFDAVSGANSGMGGTWQINGSPVVPTGGTDSFSGPVTLISCN